MPRPVQMHRQMQQGQRAGAGWRAHEASRPRLSATALRSAADADADAPSALRRRCPLQQQQQRRHVAAASAPSTTTTTTTSTTSVAPPPPPPPSASGRVLVDPAHLCVRASGTTPVVASSSSSSSAAAPTTNNEDTSLHAYMTLPVTQYYCLDPDSIAFLGGDRFRLSVGRVALPNFLGGAWVEPTVDVRVRGAGGSGGDAQSPAVVLEAERCRLRASPALEALRLDEKFALRFKARLTWRERGKAGASAAATANAKPATKASSSSSSKPPVVGEIRGDASVDVYCEVLAPFRLVPRQALESACSSVLASLARALLPVFLAQLSADYTRWTGDAEYRAARRRRAGAQGGQQQVQQQQVQQQQRPLVAEKAAVR